MAGLIPEHSVSTVGLGPELWAGQEQVNLLCTLSSVGGRMLPSPTSRLFCPAPKPRDRPQGACWVCLFFMDVPALWQ